MTIKEIEFASGIPRANIRFYEAQGLISPARAENGYRDYSEAELETLLRIKLLRSLEISIEEIKALISGETELSPVLEQHMAALAEKRETVTRLHELCGMMRADSVSFDSLDARRYLSIYEQRQTSIAAALQADTLPKVPHPFRRYAARSVDSGIYALLIYAFLTVCGVNILNIQSLGELLISIAGILLTMGLEPVMLNRFGTTPGKWIFGMYVTDMCGERPSVYTGFYRYIDILRYAYGFFIPFYSLYRLWKSMFACFDGEELPWECDTILVMRDTRNWRIAAWAGAEVAYIAALILLMCLGSMPRHMGALTPAEFAENYNRYALRENHLTEMDEKGNWSIPHRYMQNGVFYSLGSSAGQPEVEFTLDADGNISSITMSKTLSSPDVNPPSYDETIVFASRSLVRAQPWAWLGSLKLNGMFQYMSEQPFSDFSYSIHGVNISCDYEYEGYRASSSGYMFAPDNAEEYYYSMVFTMSLE